jgi:hypothetical protein
VSPGRIPGGKLVLLAGDGGHGKSFITLHLTACETTGRPAFGLTYDAPPAADVLLISCEDDYADTVVPRLIAAGADLSRVHRVDGIRGPDGKPAPFCLAHDQQMRRMLAAHPEIKLVRIDPAGAYVGRSGVDDYKDSELRTLLDPMAEVAAERGVTILIVKHLSKAATAKAVQRVGGSAGYVNAVRACYMVAPDPDDAERRLLMPVMFNLGPPPSSLSYRLQSPPDEEQTALIEKYADHLGGDDRQSVVAGTGGRSAGVGGRGLHGRDGVACQPRPHRTAGRLRRADLRGAAGDGRRRAVAADRHRAGEVVRQGEVTGTRAGLGNCGPARQHPRTGAGRGGRSGRNWTGALELEHRRGVACGRVRSVQGAAGVTIRDRVKELRRVRAGDLRPSPKNWRTHSAAQADALRGLLAEVGFAGALLARELPGGELELIDGHLRAETLPDEPVPVLAWT